MIFYSQFHDIFNNIVFLGQKAEKHNLVDVFSINIMALVNWP